MFTSFVNVNINQSLDLEILDHKHRSVCKGKIYNYLPANKFSYFNFYQIHFPCYSENELC